MVHVLLKEIITCIQIVFEKKKKVIMYVNLQADRPHFSLLAWQVKITNSTKIKLYFGEIPWWSSG